MTKQERREKKRNKKRQMRVSGRSLFTILATIERKADDAQGKEKGG